METRYFDRIRYVMKLLGLSLRANESPVYKTYSLVIIFCINVCYPFLALSGVIFGENRNLEEICIGLIYEFAMLIALTKAIVAFKNRGRFEKVLERLEGNPFLPNKERGGELEEKLIEDCVKITKLQEYCYWIYVCIVIGSNAIYTLIQRLRSSDYHDWHFSYGSIALFNVTYSPNYEIAWIYQTIAVTYTGLTYCTVDLIYAALMAHLSCQFKMLQNNLVRLVNNSYKRMLKDGLVHNCLLKDRPFIKISWKYLRDSLSNVIRYHLEILSVADEVEELYNGLLLTTILGTLGDLCLAIYMGSLLQFSDVRMMRNIFAAVAICLQILLISYWGEQMLFESQQVARAVLESDFSGTDVRFQKALVLIIMRSQKPSKVTAGKFADVCLTTFSWVLRTSYSAFMVLQSVNTRKQ